MCVCANSAYCEVNPENCLTHHKNSGPLDGVHPCNSNFGIPVLPADYDQRWMSLSRFGVLLQVGAFSGDDAGRAIFKVPCAVDTGAAAHVKF